MYSTSYLRHMFGAQPISNQCKNNSCYDIYIYIVYILSVITMVLDASTGNAISRTRKFLPGSRSHVHEVPWYGHMHLERACQLCLHWSCLPIHRRIANVELQLRARALVAQPERHLDIKRLRLSHLCEALPGDQEGL